LSKHGKQWRAILISSKKTQKASHRLDTDLTKKMKTFTEQNIAAASEFAQKASSAKDFQDFWRIQTELCKRNGKLSLSRRKS
jgi:hypothetical protein